MKMTSLTINGRTVSRLSINGREVALGSASSDALCFTAIYDNQTIQLIKEGSPDNINLQTSTDGKSWTPYNVEDIITVPNAGDKVYFKAVGSNYSMATSPNDYHKFITTSQFEDSGFEASGNVNSLLEEDPNIARTMSLEGKNFCYAYLFSGTLLTTAPELPATTLAYGCYAFMFDNCSLLTQAPVLPAEYLTDFCYYYMFENCTSLTEAPELPAYQLVDSCYAYMFQSCTSLNYVSAGFDNWVPTNATSDWLPENTGTFVCPPTLIGNTPEDQRSTSTVPSSWNMTV